MKILIISDALPYPPDSGAKIRVYNLIKRISHLCDISLVTLTQSTNNGQNIRELKKYCKTVHTIQLKRKSKLEHLPGLINYFIRGEPIENKFVFVNEMKDVISKLVENIHFDVIQIEHSYMAPYINILNQNTLKNTVKILTLHNLGYIQCYRQFKIEKDLFKKARYFLNWMLLKNWEPKFANKFDLCIVTSPTEKTSLKTANPLLKVGVIPNGVDLNYYKPLPFDNKTQDILFIGKMDYTPNIDGVFYFCDKIFPIIKKSIPNSRFIIAGSNVPMKIEELKKDSNIIVAGYVEDARPFYQQSVLSVVPLRAGSGTRLKILESMALGRAVVSTSIGCEGLEVKHNDTIIISDDPQDFAERVIELLGNKDLRKKISKNARNLVERNYCWDSIADKQIHLYEEVNKIKHIYSKK